MQEYDIIIRGGNIYDGSGAAPYKGDLAIHGDTIAALGDLGEAQAAREINAEGKAVTPGFINMLSWSVESLIADGRSQSEIRQGVTLEVMGEGTSMGPLSDDMKVQRNWGILGNSHIHYDIEWTTLGEYLDYLEKRGVSCNIASFVGSSTLRIHVMGYADREPDLNEINRMCDLARGAMEEGAVGLSAALIYPPASYAATGELFDLASAISEYDGLYISHIRGEGRTLVEAVQELVEIAETSQTRAEVYHLKASGAAHWDKMDNAIQIIEDARARGLSITADMYTYPYSGTGLDACIPPWAHEGGHAAMIARLKDPQTRERIRRELLTVSDEWENMYAENGGDKILLSGFMTEALHPMTGKTLAEVAAERGTPPEETLMDLIVEDDSRIFTMYFCMSEDNLRKQVELPWVSFCSDAESQAPEGVFLKTNPHPRAYGSFARLLAKYVRDKGIIPLQEAVRRLTSLPAANLKIERRGALQPGYFADVLVFDPAAIQDHATPEQPHQYATGMQDVFVNGVQVLQDGEHTDATPGRVVRGPGWQKKPFENVYPAELLPFLMLGREYRGTYTELRVDKEHVHDLIRMATDGRLLSYEENRPQYYAPIHAWRRLGQLSMPEAIEPLMKLFQVFRTEITREIPTVYAMIGMKAFPPLMKYFTDRQHPGYARVMAMNCLETIAKNSSDAPPTAKVALEGVLVAQLEKLEENDVLLNSALVIALTRMRSRDAIQPILAAYNAGVVEEKITGKLADVMSRLGIRVIDDPEDGTDDDDFLGEELSKSLSSQKSNAQKKKAKRKQAAKVKKLNRKKKR